MDAHGNRNHDDCGVQEKHAVTGALAEKHRAEATAFASDKADLTGKIMALRGDMHMKESELSLAKRRADLAESTQQLDRDEIKRLKCDMYKLQDELAADLEYTSKLELKRKVFTTPPCDPAMDGNCMHRCHNTM